MSVGVGVCWGGVSGCQSDLIKSTEFERRECYSSSLTGFSYRFSDSSLITALLWCVCVRERENECHWFDDYEIGSRWIMSGIFNLLLCKEAQNKHFSRTEKGTKAASQPHVQQISSRHFCFSSILVSERSCQPAMTLTLTPLMFELRIENTLRSPDATYGSLCVVCRKWEHNLN